MDFINGGTLSAILEEGKEKCPVRTPPSHPTLNPFFSKDGFQESSSFQIIIHGNNFSFVFYAI